MVTRSPRRGGRGSLRREIRRAARCAPNASIRQLAARMGCHPSTVAKHLRGTAHGREGGTHAACAAPRTSARQLALLATDSDHSVRRRVAEHPRTPPQVLRRLAVDPHAIVRARAADNLNCPEAALRRLASDSDVAPRLGVAEHHNATVGILRRLARDSDEDAQRLVACHRRCPEALWELLTNNDNEYVSQQSRMAAAVASNPQITADDVWPMSVEERAMVARSGRCPPEILAALASSDDYATRNAVAANHSTPPAALLALARADDDEGWVHEVIAEHPHAPLAALKLLTRAARPTTAKLARQRIGCMPPAG